MLIPKPIQSPKGNHVKFIGTQKLTKFLNKNIFLCNKAKKFGACLSCAPYTQQTSLWKQMCVKIFV